MEPDRAHLEQTAPVNGVVTVLVAAALVTFALYLVYVVAELLPPQPQDPLWFLNAAIVCVNALTFPLVGVLFLHLAASLAPFTDVGKRCRTWASRVATLLALLFLLLLPLLGYSTWRGVSNVQAAVKQRVDLINSNADRVRAAIQKAATLSELQQLMTEQQGPQVFQEELNTTLADLKQAKLLLVDQVKFYYYRQIPGFKSKAYEPIFIQTLRTTVLALAGSAGFAALAWNPKRQKSLLRALLEFVTKTNAKIANKLSSLRPVPDEQGRNSRLMQNSRNTLRQNEVRNQRQMNKNELQRNKFLAKFAQQREKEKKKELERQKKLESDRKD